MPTDNQKTPEIASENEWYVIRWPFILVELLYNDFMVNKTNTSNHIWQSGWEGGEQWDGGQNPVTHDADGWMTIKVVSRHKPTPRHMERCFVYNRIYDPFGQPVASASFKCITEGRLKSYISGAIVSHTELCVRLLRQDQGNTPIFRISFNTA